MQRSIALLCLFLLGGTLTSYTQNAIKLYQQPTSFIYAQLNLHTGFSNSGEGLQFGLPGRGTANQLSLQMFKVHQPLFQRA